MRLLHSLGRTHASFDDPNLVSRAGLVPVMALAQRAGLTELVAVHVRPGGECGVNAHLKVPCLVAGMAAGADSIDDMDLLRHGATPGLFGGIRAPSTLGSHLRSYTWGDVRQLEIVNRQLLGGLARRAPLLPGKDTLAFIDIDAMRKCVCGHQKQGAGFGHTKIQGKSLLVRGLDALAATISTPVDDEVDRPGRIMQQPLAEIDERRRGGIAVIDGEPQRAFRGDSGDHVHREPVPGVLHHRRLPGR